MIIDKLNANVLLTLIESEGVDAFDFIVKSIRTFSCDVRVDEMDAKAAQNTVPEKRRFGKGATLLGPFGYFHPSEIISAIADNASRGRLSKKEDGHLYTYDFYPNGEIAIIAFPRNATRTICEHTNNVNAYLTYEMLGDGSNEITDVTLARYSDNGLLETMVQVTLFDNLRKVGDINVEMYGSFEASKRICHLFTVGPADESCTTYRCFSRTYEVTYSDNLQIIDCEYLHGKEVSNITL